MSTRDLLIAARARIEKPEHWTQGCYARASDGSEVLPESPNAVCWCALGAIRVVLGGHFDPLGPFDKAEYALMGVLPDGASSPYVSDYNDNRSHRSVLRLYDKAIDACQD